MNKIILILLIIIIPSCRTTRTVIPPMTEEMYQAKKKNYLKKYTKKFVNSIPKTDMELIMKDSIIIVR
jgi:hypothetical protein